jgi:hypothetical protein
MNIGNEQIGIDIIIVHFINKFIKSMQKPNLYIKNLNDIEKTIDNFGLFWVIIQCMTNAYFFYEYITNREYLNRSTNKDLFNIYLNFYFNLDNIPPTPLRQKLEKLFEYKVIPNFREQFINNVLKEMRKTKKFEVYFKNDRDLFNIFMEKVLALVRVDPTTRIPKEELLKDPFFS